MNTHTQTHNTETGAANPWLIGLLSVGTAVGLILASVMVMADFEPAEFDPFDNTSAHSGSPAVEHRDLNCEVHPAEARKSGGDIAKDGLVGSVVGAAVGAAGGAIADGKHGAGKGAGIGALAGGVVAAARKNEKENSRVTEAETAYAECVAQS